ncbi:glycosyltransferase family 4 protein [Candidatus Bathyarchaeota archaeon]|jgi:glycogen(starch) synthase|nr:glycosyltransferase family 4 protein [Candidatus Bathyarchaeota archaeon]
MQAAIFSWEYPPRIVGQLADYLKDLAVQLVKNKVGVFVVTYHDYMTGLHDDPEGVKIYRVNNPVRTHIGVLTWVLTLNQEVERAASNIYYDVTKQIDLIDVHDWHFIPAAVTLKKALHIPFVYSAESLEDHRSHGANSPFNMAIRSIEWLGTYEAGKLLAKSDWMKDEISRIYRAPVEKIKVISPNSARWMKDILEAYRDVAGGATH